MSEHFQRFSSAEWLRYTRHLQLPGFGVNGQQKLRQSRVLIIGIGGLGAPLSLYLAAAGVGELCLIDGDVVDLSNLQRQVLFSVSDIGQNKASAGVARLLALNPEVQFNAIGEHLNEHNAHELIDSADLIIDCSDNFDTRYQINHYCTALKKTWIYASLHQFSGQCAVFGPGGACYRCLFPEAPNEVADCNNSGVIGAVAGILGTIQAAEAVKYLADIEPGLQNQLLLVDALEMNFQRLALARDPNCLSCGESPLTHKELRTKSSPVCVVNHDSAQCSPADFERLSTDPATRILDVRTHAERAAFHLGGEHIPLQILTTLNKTDFDKHDIVLCYCQSGARSHQAATFLRDQGYRALSLAGGILEYLRFKEVPKI